MTAYDDRQVMVTLAGLAYVAPIPGDDWHSVEDEEAYMLGELTSALASEDLPTQGQWSVAWLGLSEGKGNLAYIAQHASEDKLAVVVRGTVFGPGIAALVSDLYQDLRVGATEGFTVGTQTVEISAGASAAFDAVTEAVFEVPGHELTGTTLLDALTTLAGEATPTIYVTGHSLGGCTATTVALHLQGALSACTFQVYTFAAPTAGLQAFADLFDATFPGALPDESSSWRVFNRWDVVPNAWETMYELAGLYPSPPGPAQNAKVTGVLLLVGLLPGDNAYVQPATNPVRLNAEDYGSAGSLWDPALTAETTDDFIGQVEFQHSVVHAYMPLLGVQLAPPVPAPMAARAEGATVTLVEPGFVHTLVVPDPPAGKVDIA